MPTNNVKHKMWLEAKRIANLSSKNIHLTQNMGDLEILTLDIGMKKEIKKVLEEHPEFDAGTFREMIKEIQVRNKQNGDGNG